MKIFLATHAHRCGNINFVNTIENEVGQEIISKYIPEYSGGSSSIWGLASNIWEDLQIGGTIIFKAKKKITCEGVITFKGTSAELADKIWIKDNNKIYKYIILIQIRSFIDIPWNPTVVGYKLTHTRQSDQLFSEEQSNKLHTYIQQEKQKYINEINHLVHLIDEKYDHSLSIIKNLKNVLQNLSKEKSVRVMQLKAIARNSTLARKVKERAKYICEICAKPPFEQKNGELYAEAHHLIELAKNYKSDLIGLMICICPNCHRTLHHGSKNEIDKLWSGNYAPNIKKAIDYLYENI